MANWTALWHPRLIAAASDIPQWRRADLTAANEEEQTEAYNESDQDYINDHYYSDHDEQPWSEHDDDAYCHDGQPHQTERISPDFDQEQFDELWTDAFIAIPTVSKSKLRMGFAAAVSQRGAKLVSGLTSRKQVLAQLGLENEPSPAAQSLVEDFFALGFATLQIQLMTYQLRYSSNLDLSALSERAVAASVALANDDLDAAQEKLTSCFDLLAEEKNNYYAVEPDLLELVLLAPTTLGKSLQGQLNIERSMSFLMTGAVAKTLSQKTSSLTKQLRTKLEKGDCSIVGGTESELPSSLLSIESVLNQFAVGRQSYLDCLGQTPSVFMRQRFGLGPALPNVIDGLNFSGAVHVTLDDGKFPSGSMTSIRWSGIDGASVMAMTEVPLDASKDESFLDFAIKIGRQMDSAHVATLVLAHWPNKTCDSFQDVVNVAKYGGILGQFKSFDSFFESVVDPGYGDTFETDDYESPFLNQALQANSLRPISTFTNYWKQSHQAKALRALLLMVAANAKPNCSIAPDGENAPEGENVPEGANAQSASFDDCRHRITQLESQIEAATVDWTGSVDHEEIASEFAALEQALVSMSAEFGGTSLEDDSSGGSNSPCIVNLHSGSQRVRWANDSNLRGQFKYNPSSPSAVVQFADCQSQGGDLIVNVPAMGSVSLGQDSLSADALRSDPFVDQENMLRNEHFEVTIDPDAGCLRSVNFHGKRGNLAGQQLAIRMPGKRDPQRPSMIKARYSKMVCDEIKTTRLSKVAAQITTRGRLIDDEQDNLELAKFEQTFLVSRGCPVIELSIDIELLTELNLTTGNYLCLRTAWQNESARLSTTMQGFLQPIYRPWFEAPQVVEIADDALKLSLFTNGLPFHRRTSRRMLDSILVIGREEQRNFQLGLGVNVKNPVVTAVGRMSPMVSLPRMSNGSRESSASRDTSQWYFHLANRNVVVTFWDPILDNDCRLIGLRVRLQETEGRAGRLKLHCFQEVESVDRENFLNEFVRHVPQGSSDADADADEVESSAEKVKDDDRSIVAVDYVGFEFFQLKLLFVPTTGS